MQHGATVVQVSTASGIAMQIEQRLTELLSIATDAMGESTARRLIGLVSSGAGEAALRRMISDLPRPARELLEDRVSLLLELQQRYRSLRNTARRSGRSQTGRRRCLDQK
jgi:hypothetical protein